MQFYELIRYHFTSNFGGNNVNIPIRIAPEEVEPPTIHDTWVAQRERMVDEILSRAYANFGVDPTVLDAQELAILRMGVLVGLTYHFAPGMMSGDMASLEDEALFWLGRMMADTNVYAILRNQISVDASGNMWDTGGSASAWAAIGGSMLAAHPGLVPKIPPVPSKVVIAIIVVTTVVAVVRATSYPGESMSERLARVREALEYHKWRYLALATAASLPLIRQQEIAREIDTAIVNAIRLGLPHVPGGYTVYLVRRDGLFLAGVPFCVMDVIYVGMTMDIGRREDQHQLTPGRGNWRLEPVYVNLTELLARAKEQLLIARFAGRATFQNRIRSISPYRLSIMYELEIRYLGLQLGIPYEELRTFMRRGPKYDPPIPPM